MGELPTFMETPEVPPPNFWVIPPKTLPVMRKSCTQKRYLCSRWRASVRFQALIVACLTPGLTFFAVPIQANPSGGSVVHGDVIIGDGAGGNLQIDQNSLSAIINWEDFSIDPGELTQFNQISSSAAVLNRVTGGNPSEIHGALKANGSVFVINPNGILVGSGGTIDVHGLMLSTLDVSNGEFLAGGDMEFKGVGEGITNMGRINAIGGDVFLIGRTVTNSGSIQATGTVGLGAGEEILLKANSNAVGERMFVRAVGSGASGIGVLNDGTIEGAAIELKAHGNMYALAINNKGSVRATGASNSGGRVFLKGAGGSISNSGSIRAGSSSVGNSGRVLIEAAYARVDGLIAAEQGSVRVAATKDAALSGEIDVSSSVGNGGDVVVEAENIEIAATSVIDASGGTGGGLIQVGGGFQGRNADIVNASTLFVADGASFSADANDSGNGGVVILWSDDTTSFGGAISARGAGALGNGGFAEVSGKRTLSYNGVVDLNADFGFSGTLLLDPTDLSIGSGVGDDINNVALSDTLDKGTSVVITSNFGGFSDRGDIRVEDRVEWYFDPSDGATAPGTLSLLATGDIFVNSSIRSAGTGGVNLVAGWDGITGFVGAMPAFPNPALGAQNNGVGFNMADVLATMPGGLNAGLPDAAGQDPLDKITGTQFGSIFIGNDSMSEQIEVGSRFGDTFVAGHDLIMEADGGDAERYVQLGFHDSGYEYQISDVNVDSLGHFGGSGINNGLHNEWWGSKSAADGSGAGFLRDAAGDPDPAGVASTDNVLGKDYIALLGGTVDSPGGMGEFLGAGSGANGDISARMSGRLEMLGGTSRSYVQIGHGGSAQEGLEVRARANGETRTTRDGYITDTQNSRQFFGATWRTNTENGGVDPTNGSQYRVDGDITVQVAGDIFMLAAPGLSADPNNVANTSLSNGNYVQIGHGGSENAGSYHGDVTVIAEGAVGDGLEGATQSAARLAGIGIDMIGGRGGARYVQIGHGFSQESNPYSIYDLQQSGDITVTAEVGAIRMQGYVDSIDVLNRADQVSQVHIGHGGAHSSGPSTAGNFSGNGISISGTRPDTSATGNISVKAGGTYANSDPNDLGSRVGISGRASNTLYSFAQIGHGGANQNATTNVGYQGDISVEAERGDILFAGGADRLSSADWGYGQNHAQIGHGGNDVDGAKGGDISVLAGTGLGAGDLGGDIRFFAGKHYESHAQIGHGGYSSQGDYEVTYRNGLAVAVGDRADQDSEITVSAFGDIEFESGASGTTNALDTNEVYANWWYTQASPREGYYRTFYRPVQIGHGGVDSDGVMSMKNDINVTSGTGDMANADTLVGTGGITFTAGDSDRSYAQIGHGGWGVGANDAVGFSGDLNIVANGGSVTFDGSIEGVTSYRRYLGTTTDQNNVRSFDGINPEARTIDAFDEGREAYIMIGNGGYNSRGDHSGEINITSYGAVDMIGSTNNPISGHSFSTAGLDGLSSLSNGVANSSSNIWISLSPRTDTASTSGSAYAIAKGAVNLKPGTLVITLSDGTVLTDLPNESNDERFSNLFDQNGNDIGDVRYEMGVVRFDALSIGDVGATVTAVEYQSVQGNKERAFVQIGHGGYESDGPNSSANDTPGHSGNITILAADDVRFHAGDFHRASAQFGHGGYGSRGGANSGDIIVDIVGGASGGKFEMIGGNGERHFDHVTYAQVGHGGFDADGNHYGDIRITNGRNADDGLGLLLKAGSTQDSYAQIGHGGRSSRSGTGDGADSFGLNGDIVIHTQGDVAVIAGTGKRNDGSWNDDFRLYAQIGHGGWDADPSNNDNPNYGQTGGVAFVRNSVGDTNAGSAPIGLADQVGVGNWGHFGDIELISDQGSIFVGAGDNERAENASAGNGQGRFHWAQIGHGGYITSGDHFGSINVRAGIDGAGAEGAADQAITFMGGMNSFDNSGDKTGYAMLGHGGRSLQGNLGRAGDIIDVRSSGDMTFAAGTGRDTPAQLGHGGREVRGDFTAAINVYSGGDISFAASPGGVINAERSRDLTAASNGTTGSLELNGNLTPETLVITVEGGPTITDLDNGDGTGRLVVQSANGTSFTDGDVVGSVVYNSGTPDLTFTADVNPTNTANVSAAYRHNYTATTYAQLGHGGYDADNTATNQGNVGNIAVEAVGNIGFQSGQGNSAYSQLGHGGRSTQGSNSGTVDVTAGGGISFLASTKTPTGSDPDLDLLRGYNLINNNQSYSMLGHGGYDADGSHGRVHVEGEATPGTGAFTLPSAADGVRTVVFTNGANTYFDNGDGAIVDASDGTTVVGSIDDYETGAVTLTADLGVGTTVSYTALQDSDITVTAGTFATGHAEEGRGIVFRSGDGDQNFSQLGHGGYASRTLGTFSGKGEGIKGDIDVKSGGDILFVAGTRLDVGFFENDNGNNYSQLGHGGDEADVISEADFIANLNANRVNMVGFDGHAGDISVIASDGSIEFLGGDSNRTYEASAGNNGGSRHYVQLGHGGITAQGDHHGNITVKAGISEAGVRSTIKPESDILFAAGGGTTDEWSDTNSYAQLGHGGRNDGDDRAQAGNLGRVGETILVQSSNDISFTTPGGARHYAMLGNGGMNADGDHNGDIDVLAFGDITFESAQNPGYTASYTFERSATDGNAFRNLERAANFEATGGGSFRDKGVVDVNFNGIVEGTMKVHVRDTAGNIVLVLHDRDGNGELRVESTAGPISDVDANGNGTLGEPGDDIFTIGQQVGTYSATQIFFDRDINPGADAYGGQDNIAIEYTTNDTSYSFVQLGHGGYDADNGNGTTVGNRGNITVNAGGDLFVTGGTGLYNYAQIGHGGSFTQGKNFGDIIIGQDVNSSAPTGYTFTDRIGGGTVLTAGRGVQFDFTDAYAQIGHGGNDADGTNVGDIKLYGSSTDDGIGFQAKAGIRTDAYAMFGHGGPDNRTGNGNGVANAEGHSGEIVIDVTGDVNLISGVLSKSSGDDTFAINDDGRLITQIGHGGYDSDTARDGANVRGGTASEGHRGDITVITSEGSVFVGAGDVNRLEKPSFAVMPGEVAGGRFHYSMIGHGGFASAGNHSGNITVHAGYDADGNDTNLNNNSNITVLGGMATLDNNVEKISFGMIGHGGRSAEGNTIGAIDEVISVMADGDISFRAGDGQENFVQLGNGGRASRSDQAGDIRVLATGSIEFLGGTFSNAPYQAHYSAASNRGNLSLDRAADSMNVATRSNGTNEGRAIGEADLIHQQIVSGTLRLTTPEGVVLMDNGSGELVLISSGEHALADLGRNGNVPVLGTTVFATYTASNGRVVFDANFDMDPNSDGGVADPTYVQRIVADFQYSGDSDLAYAQLGNGGHDSDEPNTNTTLGARGDITVAALNGSISFIGGVDDQTYAQLGHGGYSSQGAHDGNISVRAAQDVIITGGGGSRSSAQIGHGGYDADGNHTGVIKVSSGSGSLFTSLGVGQFNDVGDFDGTVGGDTFQFGATDAVGGKLTLTGGTSSETYAMIGHGGYETEGNHGDNPTTLTENEGIIAVSAYRDIDILGGAGSRAFAQIGHGGARSEGDLSGDVHVITETGDLTLKAASSSESYALIGHGDDRSSNTNNATGSRAGGIFVVADEITLDRSGNENAWIGHTFRRTGTNNGNPFATDNLELNNLDAASTYIAGGYQVIAKSGLITRSDGVNNSNGNIIITDNFRDNFINPNIAVGDFAYSASAITVNSILDSSAASGTYASTNGTARSNNFSLFATDNINVRNDIQNPGSGDVNLIAGASLGNFTSSGVLEGIDYLDCPPVGSFTLAEVKAQGFDFGDSTGSVIIDPSATDTTAGQSAAVGSRDGDTNVFGYAVTVSGGDFATNSAQIGFNSVDAGATDTTGDATGNIMVEAGAGGVSVSGGGGGDNQKFAMIGHGGDDGFDIANPGGAIEGDTTGNDPTHSGMISVRADRSTAAGVGNIEVRGAAGDRWAMIGHGGDAVEGNHNGDIVVIGNDITLAGGNTRSFTQIGHGGKDSDGNLSGNIFVNWDPNANSGAGAIAGGGGDLTLQTLGTGQDSYTQIGHGGRRQVGLKDGVIRIENLANVLLEGGDFARHYAQIGHGGHQSSGNIGSIIDSDITVKSAVAGSTVQVLGGDSTQTYAQIGHGGVDAAGDIGAAGGVDEGAAITVSVTGVAEVDSVIVRAGSIQESYAQIGHGGDEATGAGNGFRGDVSVVTGLGNVVIAANPTNTFGGNRTSAMIGHGGFGTVNAGGDFVGDITLTTGNGALRIDGSDEGNANFAMVGHGGINNDATGLGHRGDIKVSVTGDISVTAPNDDSATVLTTPGFAKIGHGGRDVDGDLSGLVSVSTTGGAIQFAGGSEFDSFAQLGHGGTAGTGDYVGAIQVRAAGDIDFAAGTGPRAFAQLGHGGNAIATGTTDAGHSGTIYVATTGGAINFSGGMEIEGPPLVAAQIQAYSQLGHGGYDTDGDHFGAVVVRAHNEIAFSGGNATSNFAHLGHGGQNSDASNGGTRQFDGNITVEAGAFGKKTDNADFDMNLVADEIDFGTAGTLGAVSFLAGDAQDTYVMIGHGGRSSIASANGNIDIDARGAITLTGASAAGTANRSFAQFGHGGRDADARSSFGYQGDVNLFTTAGNIAITAGESNTAYSQVGHGGRNDLNDGTVEGGRFGTAFSGDISVVTNDGNVSVKGSTGVGDASGQIGHGGRARSVLAANTLSQTGHTGRITVIAADGDASGDDGDITVDGENSNGMAMIGHGGRDADGDHASPDSAPLPGIEPGFRITAARNLSVTAGGTDSFAQIGNGGQNSDGAKSGNMIVTVGGNALITGSGLRAYAQVGHGGVAGSGDATGAIDFNVADGSVTLQSGALEAAYAQIGHGGTSIVGNLNGEICVHAGDIVDINASIGTGEDAFARIGHGGIDATGAPTATMAGNVTVVSGTSGIAGVTLNGGDALNRYAQIGHGGINANADMSGEVYVVADNRGSAANGGDVTLNGGDNSTSNYAMIGHGDGEGYTSLGQRQGGIHILATKDLTGTNGAGLGLDATTMLDAGNVNVWHQTARNAEFAGQALTNATYEGGNGFQIFQTLDNLDPTSKDASELAVMAGENFGTGDVNIITSSDIDIVFGVDPGNPNYNQSEDLLVNSSDDFFFVTGGDITFLNSYQNAGTGSVTVVAGWSGAESAPAIASVSYEELPGGGFNYCKPTIQGGGVNIDFNDCDTFGNGNGTITLGSTNPAEMVGPVIVGSRLGRNVAAAYGMTLNGGNDADEFSQFGFRSDGTGTSGNSTGNVNDGDLTTGAIDLFLKGGGLTLNGGTADGTFAQIGHGGAGSDAADDINANITISFCEPGDISLFGGTTSDSYAQIGHGGSGQVSTLGGDIRVGDHPDPLSTAAGAANLTMLGGGENSYVQIGHGGSRSAGDPGGEVQNSTITLDVVGAIDLDGNGINAYAQVGHGGSDAEEMNTVGNILINTAMGTGTGDISLDGGAGANAYAQIGHGGTISADDFYFITREGAVTIGAADNILLGRANAVTEGTGAYTQIGHGGMGRTTVNATDQIFGDIALTAANSVEVEGGLGTSSYSNIGHGGDSRSGSFYGNISVTATNGAIHLNQPNNNVVRGANVSTMIGHGGFASVSSKIGEVTLLSKTGVAVTMPSGSNASAQVGHGGVNSTGFITGAIANIFAGKVGVAEEFMSSNISVQTEGDITVRGSVRGAPGANFAQIGHGGFNAGDDSSMVIPTIPTDIISGTITLNNTINGNTTGDILLIGAESGPETSHTMIGHGGHLSGYSVIDSLIDIDAAGDLILVRPDTASFTMVGHGGEDATGITYSGAINVDTGGAITLGAATGDLTPVLTPDIGAIGANPESSAQIGHGGTRTNATLGGAMTINAGGTVTVKAGISTGADQFSQIGHGGYLAMGAKSGNVSVTSTGGDVDVLGGTSSRSYALVGHGGFNADGAISSSDVSVTSDTGDITVRGGSAADAFAIVGHGGRNTDGTKSGNVTVTATAGDVLVQGGTNTAASALIGLGGHNADDAITGGTISVTAGTVGSGVGTVSVLGGTGIDAFAQIGVGGRNSTGSKSATAINVTANGAIDTSGNMTPDPELDGNGVAVRAGGTALNSSAYAQIGVGGHSAYGDSFNSAVSVTSNAGGVLVSATDPSNQSYAHIGNGGRFDLGTPANTNASFEVGSMMGAVTVTALGATSDIFVNGGGGTSYAQIGHGGNQAGGTVDAGAMTRDSAGVTFSGAINLDAGRDLRIEGGGFNAPMAMPLIVTGNSNGFALVGHGGTQSAAVLDGQINVDVGNSVTLQGGGDQDVNSFDSQYAQLGHGGKTHEGAMTGNILINQDGGAGAGSVSVLAGDSIDSYAHIGHGGASQSGSAGTAVNGSDILINTGTGVTVLGGSFQDAYAQIGHGGDDSDAAGGQYHGAISVITTTGNVQLQANPTNSITAANRTSAQIGHGGFQSTATMMGDIKVDAQAGGIALAAGNVASNNSALIGHGGIETVGTKDGAIDVDAGGPLDPASTIFPPTTAILLVGGSTSANGMAQIGHGGSASTGIIGGDANFMSNIDVATSFGDIFLVGNPTNSQSTPTQIGHGGLRSGIANETISGTVTVRNTAGSISLLGAANGTVNSYVQVGHAGFESNYAVADQKITVSAVQGGLTMTGASSANHVMVGHGGEGSTGDVSGDIEVTANAGATLTGGNEADSVTQIGHGGQRSEGTNLGTIDLNITGGDLTLQSSQTGTSSGAYVTVGHGGRDTTGASQMGAIDVAVLNGSLIMNAANGGGLDSYTQIGHGGSGSAATLLDGHICIRVDSPTTTGIQMTGGNQSGEFSQIGHGGLNTVADMTGGISLAVGNDGGISLTGGAETAAQAMIGHGALSTSTGDRSGQIDIIAGGAVSLTDGGANSTGIGHGSDDTAASAGGLGLLADSLTTNNEQGVTGMISSMVSGGDVEIMLTDGSLTVDGPGAAIDTSSNVSLVASGDVNVLASIQNAGDGSIGIAAGWNGSTGLTDDIDFDTCPLITDLSISLSDIIASPASFGVGGAVAIGNGLQTEGISVGSKAGTTEILGSGVALTGGSDDNTQAQVGYRSDGVGSISGAINLTTKGDGLKVNAGGGDESYAQVGHGGSRGSGVISSTISLTSLEKGILDISGDGDRSYAQIGHGGGGYNGDLGGGIVPVGEYTDVTISGGTEAFSYAMFGHGGANSIGSKSGALELVADSISLKAGDGQTASAQFGHGGFRSSGVVSGSIKLESTVGDISAVSGDVGVVATTQIGHGGFDSASNVLDQSIEVVSAGDVVLDAGASDASSSLIGHGGGSADPTTLRGTISVEAEGEVRVLADTGVFSFGQIGHTTGDDRVATLGGDISVVAQEGVILTGVDLENGSYAKVGHGDDLRGAVAGASGRGSRDGDIEVSAGSDIRLASALIGHLNDETNATATATSGLQMQVGSLMPTDPAAGDLVTDDLTQLYGEEDVRIYLPTRANNQIEVDALINGVSWTGTPVDPTLEQGDDEFTREITGTNPSSPLDHDFGAPTDPAPANAAGFAFYYNSIELNAVVDPGTGGPGTGGPGTGGPGTGGGTDPVGGGGIGGFIDENGEFDANGRGSETFKRDDRIFDDEQRVNIRRISRPSSFIFRFEGFDQYGPNGESIWNYLFSGEDGITFGFLPEEEDQLVIFEDEEDEEE